MEKDWEERLPRLPEPQCAEQEEQELLCSGLWCLLFSLRAGGDHGGSSSSSPTEFEFDSNTLLAG